MASEDVVKTPRIAFRANIGELLDTFDCHSCICSGTGEVLAVVVQNVSSVRSYRLGTFQGSTPISLPSTGIWFHQDEQLIFSRHRCNSLQEHGLESRLVAVCNTLHWSIRNHERDSVRLSREAQLYFVQMFLDGF